MIRWKKKEKKDWQEGDIRVVRKFLFFPRCLPTHEGAEEWRWMGCCLIKQRLDRSHDHIPDLGVARIWKWRDMEWVDGR